MVRHVTTSAIVFSRYILLSFILIVLLLSFSTRAIASPTFNNGGTISVDTTWTPNESPYVIAGRLIIQSGVTLTIQSGTVIKFDGRLPSGITCYGKIEAVGSEEQPIYFTSIFDDTVGGDVDGDNGRIIPMPGTAGDIHVTGAGAALNIKHCKLRYGGKDACGFSICRADYGAIATIDCCEFSDSSVGVNCTASQINVDNTFFCNLGTGLRLLDCTDPGIKRCKFTLCQAGVGLSANGTIVMRDNVFDCIVQAAIINAASGTVNVSGNSAAGGSLNGIVLNCYVNQDLRLTSDPGMPYIIQSLLVHQGQTLTLDPGVVIKFDLNSGIVIYGSLKANGNPFAPVYFTSIRDDSICGDTNGDGNQTSPAPGDWARVSVHNQTSVTMNYCVIKYGGQGFYSDDAVIYLSSGSKLIASNCTIVKNVRGVYSLGTVSLSNAVNMTNCIVTDNTYYGCFVGGSGNKFDHNDFWPDTGNCYGTDPVMIGNIFSDPLFVNAQSDNFRLQSGSPCIDAGNGTELDGTTTDMGAFPLMADSVASVSGAKLRSLNIGPPFVVVKGVVSAVFGLYFYLQSEESMSGLRVYSPYVPPMSIGNVVIVSGQMGLNTYGEKQMQGMPVVVGVAYVAPVYMNCSSLGGGDFHYDRLTRAGQEGIAGARGLNNLGLLVKTSGAFKFGNSSTFYVNDGSAGDIKCVVPSGSVINPDWEYVSVTGISSCERTSNGLQRVLRVRNQSDISAYK